MLHTCQPSAWFSPLTQHVCRHSHHPKYYHGPPDICEKAPCKTQQTCLCVVGRHGTRTSSRPLARNLPLSHVRTRQRTNLPRVSEPAGAPSSALHSCPLPGTSDPSQAQSDKGRIRAHEVREWPRNVQEFQNLFLSHFLAHDGAREDCTDASSRDRDLLHHDVCILPQVAVEPRVNWAVSPALCLVHERA